MDSIKYQCCQWHQVVDFFMLNLIIVQKYTIIPKNTTYFDNNLLPLWPNRNLKEYGNNKKDYGEYQ